MYGNVRRYFYSGNHYNRRILNLAENQKSERMAEKPLNNRIMDAHSFEAQYSDGKTKISLNVGVYIFQEDNVYISYCPALDLSGYGETENAAKTSFGQTLGMYIEYCLHKNTLVKDLQKHGWKIKSMKQKRIKAPDMV